MVDRTRTKRKPQTRALAFRLVFVDIRFLLVSLKQKKKDDQTNLDKEGVFQRWRNVFLFATTYIQM